MSLPLQMTREQDNTGTRVFCSLDRSTIVPKVSGRKPVSLDTNVWINIAEDKSAVARSVKAELRRLVAEGKVFCPLSPALIWELYKQSADSRLRVGTVMEELSLNLTYADQSHVFRVEVEKAIRALAGVETLGPLATEMYVPVLGYLSSQFALEFSNEFPSGRIDEFTREVSERLTSLTLTELLRMRTASRTDNVFDYMRQRPAPRYSEMARRMRAAAKGDRQRVQRFEAEAVFKRYIEPVLPTIPPPVKARFFSYLLTVKKDKYGGCLGETLSYMPAIYNYVELMSAISQQPDCRDKASQFFDYEIIPIPMAYASVFVAHDKGIRDLLTNRTNIQKRSRCRYCSDLNAFERWLKTDAME